MVRLHGTRLTTQGSRIELHLQLYAGTGKGLGGWLGLCPAEIPVPACGTWVRQVLSD